MRRADLRAMVEAADAQLGAALNLLAGCFMVGKLTAEDKASLDNGHVMNLEVGDDIVGTVIREYEVKAHHDEARGVTVYRMRKRRRAPIFPGYIPVQTGRTPSGSKSS